MIGKFFLLFGSSFDANEKKRCRNRQTFVLSESLTKWVRQKKSQRKVFWRFKSNSHRVRQGAYVTKNWIFFFQRGCQRRHILLLWESTEKLVRPIHRKRKTEKPSKISVSLTTESSAKARFSPLILPADAQQWFWSTTTRLYKLMKVTRHERTQYSDAETRVGVPLLNKRLETVRCLITVSWLRIRIINRQGRLAHWWV